MGRKRLLVLYPTIAPYRIDYFNDLNRAFDAKICLQYWNLKDQTFDYEKIFSQFEFSPEYLPEGNAFGRLARARRIIEDFRPDLVLTNEFGLLTLFAVFFKRLHRKDYRVVVMSDDSFDMLAGGNDFSLKHRIGRSVLAPLADEVVTVDPQVCDYYRKRHDKGFFFPIIADERKAAQRYERILPLSRQTAVQYDLKGRKVIISVSRLVDLKNLHRVIDAYGKISSDAVLVIVGDGPERESLEAHAAEVGKRIVFAGRFDGDELYCWYNIASVLILASYKEPFGAVTNEALLAGCRVVVSRAAGSSCLVDEANGQLVDPMDVDGIAAALDTQLSLEDAPDCTRARASRMNISYAGLIESLIDKLEAL